MTFLKNLAFLAVLCALGTWIVSTYMEVKAAQETFSRAEDVPPVQAVVVPGASVYRSGKLSPALRQRMDAAVELVLRKPGTRLLLSGHEIPQGYSETRAMQEYAVAHGVPPGSILTDTRGQSTFLTLLNCKEDFGLTRVALVSHGYHLPRALYIARKLGLIAYGRVVEMEDEGPAPVREWGGRVKDFLLVRVFRYFHVR